ncbi:MAG: DUF4832 domain-containing protein [Oscillospiraceae bacterium]|nr:DUF4832 domain-containing protein [Oscillospiraceae bacterium]
MNEMIYESKCFTATDELLVNPHMGFMTFQRFNGDKLNALDLNNGQGWTEGYPIEYQKWDGESLKNENHPDTSMAYWRVYWRFVEPEHRQYRWDMFDRALQTAHERKQTLMLRIAPYGSGKDQDIPDWYRASAGAEPEIKQRWRTNPENPLYAESFGEFIKAIAERYDGHPDLDSVDMSFIGYWGEGGDCEQLSDKTMKSLTDSYIDNFKKTPLMSLLTDDKRHHDYCRTKLNKIGYRADCLGDMGGFSETWSHMHVAYPETITEFGLTDAWKTGPVSFEVCWVVQHWLNMGWDIDYIIDQSLKWHITSFNAKSSPIPEKWQPNVERWLKKMGYRFALRHIMYSGQAKPGERLHIKSWWENLGVAPIYYKYPLNFRLKNENNSYILKSGADITGWLPGDIIFTEDLLTPHDAIAGNYTLQAAITGRFDDNPAIKLANDNRDSDGWYNIGKVIIK